MCTFVYVKNCLFQGEGEKEKSFRYLHEGEYGNLRQGNVDEGKVIEFSMVKMVCSKG